MDTSIRLHAAAVLQHSSGTLRDEVWMELQGQQGLRTVLEAIQAEAAKSDSDQVIDNLVSMLEELLPCEVSGFVYSRHTMRKSDCSYEVRLMTFGFTGRGSRKSSSRPVD